MLLVLGELIFDQIQYNIYISVCRGTTIVSNGHTGGSSGCWKQSNTHVFFIRYNSTTCLQLDRTQEPVHRLFYWWSWLLHVPLQTGNDRNQYNVSAPPDGSYCNLIILNATTDEAGSYTCADVALSSSCGQPDYFV